MTFGEWLQNQTDRDDPTGDLARDAQRDKRPQPTQNTLTAWRTHLHSLNASREALAALVEAWEEYRKAIL